MAKATYSQEVNVEEIKFDDDVKEKLKNGELAIGSGVRIRKDGDQFVYSQLRSVNYEMVSVDEGQFIVTYPDGSQELLNADDAKSKLNITKEAKADTSAVKKAAKDAAKQDAENSKTLAERAAESGNTITAQSNAEEAKKAELNKPAATANQESKNV